MMRASIDAGLLFLKYREEGLKSSSPRAIRVIKGGGYTHARRTAGSVLTVLGLVSSTCQAPKRVFLVPNAPKTP